MSVGQRVQRRAALGAPDVRTARIVARRTWRFFETFVGDEDHWLPPDNFQEDPPVVAHRTSPTNIGLLLLSSLAARDFGYIGLIELIERVEFTFAKPRQTAKISRPFLQLA